MHLIINDYTQFSPLAPNTSLFAVNTVVNNSNASTELRVGNSETLFDSERGPVKKVPVAQTLLQMTPDESQKYLLSRSSSDIGPKMMVVEEPKFLTPSMT